MSNTPYPSLRSGADLSKNRTALLERWKRGHSQPASTQISSADQQRPVVKPGPGE